MKKLYLLLIAMAALAISCRTEMSYTEFQTRQLQPPVTTNVTPVAADLDVSPTRITYVAKYPSNSMSVAKAKQFAIAAAMKQYNADVLVAPLASVSKNNSEMVVTVCGYPATYKNFRKASVQDCKTFLKMKPSKK